MGLENSEEDVNELIRSLSKITLQARTSSASKADVKRQMNDFVRDVTLKVYHE
jgi:hypothetical protein